MMLQCDDCRAIDSIREYDGDNVCTNCGLVSRFPILVADYSYSEHSDIMATTTTSSPKPELSSNIDIMFEYVNSRLQVDSTTLRLVKDFYMDYKRRYHRITGNKHIVFILVCFYIVSDSRSCYDIVSIFPEVENVSEFHKIYNIVSSRTGRYRDELRVEDYIISVRNMLCIEDYKFNRECMKYYHGLINHSNGYFKLRQVRYTKLFSVIGYIIFSRLFTTENRYSDSDLFKLLNITRPTYTKIIGIISSL